MNSRRLAPLRPYCLLASFLIPAGGLLAAPLTQTTAVQVQPDINAPVITFLKAGIEPVPSTDTTIVVPAGWMAVSIPGPTDGYVLNADLTKDLNVKPGTPVRLSPDPRAPVVLVAARGDNLPITGLRGKWTQVRIDKPLTGFIQVALPPAVAPAPPPPTNAPGKPAAVAGDNASLGRVFEGKFASAKRHFFWQTIRPYDWEIDNPSGGRAAYLDVGKLLLTEQIDKYVGHDVIVRGTAEPVSGSGDIVIEVESLQLK